MEKIFCENCGKEIKNGNGIMFELDQRTYTYTKDDVPVEFSQGGFYFGKDCARKLLKEDKLAKDGINLQEYERIILEHRLLYNSIN